MYKNKAHNGSNNICGGNVKRLREQLSPKTSQKKSADLLQVAGPDIDKNAVQRIESGQRFVTDIELCTLVKVLHTSYEELLKD